MNNLISIIVPVHNAEKYINRCADSIKNQTYHNYEVLFVENGSTDHTIDICTKICQEAPRFILLNSDIGLSKARNIGLEKAEGDWFVFVDADDWLEPNYLEVLLSNALKYGAGLSACSFSKDFVYQLKSEVCNDTIILNGPAQCVHNYICLEQSMEGMVWNKLYDRKVFGSIRFDEKLIDNEDCAYTYEVTSRCNKACVSNAQLYHWLQRKNSLSHTHFWEKDLIAANVFLRLLELTETYKDFDVNYTLLYNYFNRMINTLFRVKIIHGKDELVDARRRCKQIYGRVKKKLTKKILIKYWIVCIKP